MSSVGPHFSSSGVEEFSPRPLPMHNETVSFKIWSPSFIPNEPIGTCHGKSIKDKGTGPMD